MHLGTVSWQEHSMEKRIKFIPVLNNQIKGIVCLLLILLILFILVVRYENTRIYPPGFSIQLKNLSNQYISSIGVGSISEVISFKDIAPGETYSAYTPQIGGESILVFVNINNGSISKFPVGYVWNTDTVYYIEIIVHDVNRIEIHVFDGASPSLIPWWLRILYQRDSIEIVV